MLATAATARAGSRDFCQTSPDPAAGERAAAVHDVVCKGGTTKPWLLDVPDPTELEIFANATECAGLRPEVESDAGHFLAWCLDDFAKIDDARAKKLVDQLGIARRREGSDWLENAPKWRKKLAELAANPRWKPLFEARAKGVSDWNSALAANRPLYDQAVELRTGATAGCTAKALQLLTQFLAKTKPATLDAVRTALADPVGYEIYTTALACSAAEGLGGEAFVLMNQPPQWEGGMSSADDFKVGWQYGPRVAATVAVETELAKLAKTDAKLARLHVHAATPTREERNEPLVRANPDGVSGYHPARGTIAAMKPQSDGRVLVTFKTETLVHDVGECHKTNQIWRIDADGTVEYWQDCKVTGQEKERVTPHAIYVHKDLTAGLKVGRMVSYFWHGGAYDKNPTDGTIHTIWADAKRKAITGWAGTSW